MKTRLVVLSVFFLLSMTSLLIMLFLGGNQWVVAGVAITTLVMAMMNFGAWMNLLAQIAKQSGKIFETETNLWSLQNVDIIARNHNRIEKKFEVAAELIVNLSKEESLGSSHDLPDHDAIARAVNNLRHEMKKIKEDENQRTWINLGLAKFSDILRNKSEIKEYCYQIISNLVKYMGANQGGLYVEYQGEERYMELRGCYAYERRKHHESKVLIGQGLLGQCMLEKDLIFMTDVPKDYIRITSGLGEATPRCIVVMPLIENDTFYGAIEMASFQALKPHQIEFLKKVGENIASEVASIKNIENTKRLLSESNLLAQELQTREEEMRQSLEELAATQGEMARKQSELTGILNAIDLTIATAEFDMTGTFKTGNEIFLKVLGYRQDELTKKDFPFFMGDDHNTIMMWENLRLGKLFSGEFKMHDKSGKELWLTGTFNPIVLDGNKAKIMMFAQFTTQEKEKLNDLTEMVHAFKSALPVAEFSESFTCKTANEKFLKLFGLSRLNLKAKNILDFIDAYYHCTWKTHQSEVLRDGHLTVNLPVQLPDHSVTYEVTFIRTHDLNGHVSKIVMLLIREVREIVPLLAVG